MLCLEHGQLVRRKENGRVSAEVGRKKDPTFISKTCGGISCLENVWGWEKLWSTFPRRSRSCLQSWTWHWREWWLRSYDGSAPGPDHWNGWKTVLAQSSFQSDANWCGHGHRLLYLKERWGPTQAVSSLWWKNSLTRYVLSTCFASGLVQGSGGTDTPTRVPSLEKQSSKSWANKQSQLIAISGAIRTQRWGNVSSETQGLLRSKERGK